ncbi:MAG TPA: hypothetical protein VFI61_01280, partial [Patescibacteria group bacterium]|nr:hypothetical protein [Patescibacteria group bacterium]
PLFTFYLLLFSVAIFMTHNKSSFIWESIKILSFVQFPWRFLSIVIFSGSLIGACFLTLIENKWLRMISIIIVFLSVALNWQYFKPEHFYKDVTDETKLSGQSFTAQQQGSLLDYLPKTALEPRRLPEKLKNFVNNSNSWELKTTSDKESVIEVPVFDFPGWKVFIDGKETTHSNKNVLGIISVVVPAGDHVIVGEFTNTPIRTFGNTLTIISFLLLVLTYAKGRKFFN